MEQASDHQGFLSRISSPAWRWGTLFVCWGVLYLCWVDFVLLTNIDEFFGKFVLRLCVAGVACLPLLATHLAGLRFAPKRWLRVLLWLFSLTCLGMWLAGPVLPLFKWDSPEIFEWKWWVPLALGCQLAADTFHTVHEARGMADMRRPQWCRSIAVGLAFALLPLGGLVGVALWGRLLKTQYECTAMVEKFVPWTEEMEQKRSAAWEAFKAECAEWEAAWTAGEYAVVFEKWLALKGKYKDSGTLEVSRLRELPSLLRKGIPDDEALCHAIQEELRASETAMAYPLEAEYSEFQASARSYLLDGSFWREYEDWGPFRFVRFSHLTEPIENVPFGVEKVFRWKTVRLVDEFYRMRRMSLETPLSEMPRLRAQFDRWLDELPWSFAEFAPNRKCMDGVGVHINRYDDLNGLLEWQAVCREAIVGIAVHQYRLKHGEWPADLAQLVPEFLPELPRDPFNEGMLQLALHPKIEGAVCVFAAHPTGEDVSPDAWARNGFTIPIGE